ncbi:MAG TPA: SDR family oxidoreductase [Candidatus Sulfotelmatobacter sp.]|jgi:NAD(P)-dependent dehydrogenase (short-subunit alcohol dehydrogenase family)|nr:SDR family oxidoreductase [Candidatus Sulfotelmatobacter sp.]
MGNAQQTVLITGATDGLGRAAALLLAQKGYRVFAAGRSTEKRAELDRLAASGKLPLESLELDVCDENSVSRALQQVLQKAGNLDVLINNAGVGLMAVAEELKLEDLRRIYETNIFGLLRMTQAALPHMRARKSGRILMLSSVAGILTPPTYGAYSSSKHAVEALSNALRLELYPFNIEVILIEPGYIMTNFQQTAKGLAESYIEGSAASPYSKIYEGSIAGATNSRRESKTTPEDCARVMLHAIEASHPKARYTVTPLAKWAAFGKRMLPDTLMDSFLRRKFGIVREEEE